MSRSIILSAFWFAAFGLFQLNSRPSHNRGGAAFPNAWCGAPGTVMNALTAEMQARRALGEPAFSPKPLVLYSLAMVDGGFIVRLGPDHSSAGRTLDGLGGILWVDGATGCVKMLRELHALLEYH